MFPKKITAIIIASAMLASCMTADGDWDLNPSNYGAGGLFMIALVVIAVSGTIAIVSDERLKEDIHPYSTLANGIRLYSFRYWNDDATYVGVLAQDLLEDERFNHAVILDRSGYYKVDLSTLGLGIVGDEDRFVRAGEAAIVEASPIAN